MCAFFDRFKKPTPNIVESPPPPKSGQGAGLQQPEYRMKPYFIVASVEMGNTTTKCILTGTNLETGRSYVINKTVSMSRDVRLPKEGEEERVQGSQNVFQQFKIGAVLWYFIFLMKR